MHTSRNRLSTIFSLLGAGIAGLVGSVPSSVLAAASARAARPPRKREISRVLASWRYNRYAPHQGRREVERRRQQIERGILYTN